jgi:hypothetical protein
MAGHSRLIATFRSWVFTKLSEPPTLYLHPDLADEFSSANITDWSGGAFFVYGDQKCWSAVLNCTL